MNSTVHVRFEGKSFDIPVDQLDVAVGSSDGEVKAALAGYLDVATNRFQHYVIERHGNGNVTVRPEAVFG
jgi:hypothetical protein